MGIKSRKESILIHVISIMIYEQSSEKILKRRIFYKYNLKSKLLVLEF
jgi:hypothetical protein